MSVLKKLGVNGELHIKAIGAGFDWKKISKLLEETLLEDEQGNSFYKDTANADEMWGSKELSSAMPSMFGSSECSVVCEDTITGKLVGFVGCEDLWFYHKHPVGLKMVELAETNASLAHELAMACVEIFPACIEKLPACIEHAPHSRHGLM